MDAGELVIKASLDTKDFTIQIKETEQELATLEKRFEETKSLKPYKGQKEDLEQLAREAENTRNKLVGLYKQQNKINQQGFSKASGSLKSISKGLTNVVKTIGKWALAMFAVRSIYTGIRQIISQVSQYNKQVATDLDYMKYSIAQALTPVVEYLVKLFYAILQNVRNIIESLTGFNIFANAGAKGFKEANKEAKGLQKTLDKAGFDEFTALNDNKGGGGEKDYDPSVDLSKKNNLVVKGVGNTIDNIKEMVSKAYSSIKENVEKALTDVGISKKVIDSFKRMISGVEKVIKGVLDVIGGVIDMAIGLLTGNGDLLTKGFIRFVDGIGEILWGALKTQLNMYQTIGMYMLDIAIKLFKDIWDKFKEILGYFGVSLDDIGKYFGTFLEYAILGPFRFAKDLIMAGIDGIKKGFEVLVESAKKLGTSIYNTFNNAWTKVTNLFSKGGKIFHGFVEGVSSVFKNMVNHIIEGINTVVGESFKKVNSALNKIRDKLPVLKLVYDKNPIPVPKIPKLARGGIVNNPGAGVMMGNYIAGESGREAVVPLTDPNALREIGMAIGRYITINNVVENYMDSRRINRVLQQSRNSDMIANNGGVI